MEVIKKITIIAVLIASLMLIIEMSRDRYENYHRTPIYFPPDSTSLSSCGDAKAMAKKYRHLSMNGRNQEKRIMYEQRMSAHATYYQTFCKD